MLGGDEQVRRTMGTALTQNYLGLAELLLANGADVNATNVLGASALHLAAAKGDVAMVGRLFEHPAAVKTRNLGGEGPLFAAARSAAGLGGRNSEIFGAVAQCEIARVEAFLRAHPEAANARLEGGASLLMQAATSGWIEVVKLLFKNQADPNRLDDAEHRMFMTTNDTIIRVLVAAKADINAGNDDGESW